MGIELKTGSNLCVVSAYDDAFREIGEFTSRVNTTYCIRQHYDFRVHTDGFDTSRHPSWSKIKFIRQALENYEWVMWIDADAVFTNHFLRIIDIIKLGGDMFVCRESRNIINFGVFLIHRCDWSKWLLDRMWQLDKWGKDGWWEQSAFNELVFEKEIGTQVVHYPMRAFNSVAPPYGIEDMVWRPGDFIAHRLGGGSIEERIVDLGECLVKTGMKCLALR